MDTVERPTPVAEATLTEALVVETVRVGELAIAFDSRILRPRPWTVAQSYWAADVLRDAPPGPVLELCAGAGHIGLASLHDNDRRLVAVDIDPVAAAYVRTNAEAAGLSDRVRVRVGDLEEVVRPDERFAVVVADPPWVTSDRVGDFPEDPLLAINGGADGLSLARRCLAVTDRHLALGGTLVLQLGSTTQLEMLAPEVEASRLEVVEVREYGTHGVLVRLDADRP